MASASNTLRHDRKTLMIKRSHAAVSGRAVQFLAALLLAAVALLSGGFAHAADNYLEPEVAFKFSARMIDAKTAEVSYAIADGYYMYRERFAFKADGAALGTPLIPKGKVHFDETFQKDVETYRNAVAIRVPVDAAGPFTLTATGQGCADQGLCYPPMQSSIKLDPAIVSASTAVSSGTTDTAPGAPPDAETGRIEASLNSGKLLAIVPLFLLLGLGLAFTPCVLPMVPILSSIIVGDRAGAARGRGLLLSAIYALGMAIVYTLLGVAAGLAGEGLAAALQNPWVLGAFALLMVALSLSMFGVYQLQMPAAIQARLAQASERQSAGKLAGVFVMGALSALIVGPCVAAPLAGTLVFISHTRDVLVGGSALFAMAAGMSIPLLLVGASAGALLPRAGAWMNAISRFFGVLMLATALWMVSPVIPPALQMAGWAALGIGYGAWLLRPGNGGWLAKAAALVFAALGLLQLAGLATGGRDPLAPLAHFTGNRSAPVHFARVQSVQQLDAMVAGAQGKPVMLDFYADWCVSCKEMEKLTFTDPRVRARFADMLLLQADVTANNADDKALLKRFNLFGPPGIIFFDRQGHEISGGRVIGYQDADKFLRSLAVAQ
jgi:thioredoxin:protein disulfide reductase